jgi:hypothetical protein
MVSVSENINKNTVMKRQITGNCKTQSQGPVSFNNEWQPVTIYCLKNSIPRFFLTEIWGIINEKIRK